jgi:hypothetical protein
MKVTAIQSIVMGGVISVLGISGASATTTLSNLTTALTTTSTVPTVTDGDTLPKGGDFYAGAFNFKFEISLDTLSSLTSLPSTGLIVSAYYASTSLSVGYAVDALVITKTGNSYNLSMKRADSISTIPITNTTTLGNVRNTSVFNAQGTSTAYTLKTGVYTLSYLGGPNNSAAANLYLGDTLVASFTGGQFNLNGGGSSGTNPLTFHSNSTFDVHTIPEPATASLSLLTLVGLAMRRRVIV